MSCGSIGITYFVPHISCYLTYIEQNLIYLPYKTFPGMNAQEKKVINTQYPRKLARKILQRSKIVDLDVQTFFFFLGKTEDYIFSGMRMQKMYLLGTEKGRKALMKETYKK